MKRIWVWSFLIMVSSIVLIFYYSTDPVHTHSGVPCTFKIVTGYNCSGCGGQRALHLLLHGEFLQALRYNFLIIFFPFFIYLLYVVIKVYILKENNHIPKFMFSNDLGTIVLVIIILFTILRNIPYKPFIYLAPPP